ncbi:MAG: glycoside hydrolase family 10 protein [Bacilli bacterium]
MQPIKRFSNEGNVTYYQSKEEVLIPSVYQEKEAELRGIWFSTVNNIDIPKMESIAQYQTYLNGVIAKVKEYHFNTIVFQVRPTNDAWYPSTLNPWTSFITGEQGRDPGFDVFGWFVDECKKEKLNVHAWLNPYRVCSVKLTDVNQTKAEYLNSLAPNNFARLHPELVIETVEHKLILDPASEMVREFVAESALEIAKNYDVKAIHMDDYFYPYEAIKDDSEQTKFLASGFKTLGDYRRHNVDLLIKLMHEKLLTLNKKVEFGISPFGIYRTNTKWFKEPNESAWEHGSDNHFSCYNCYAGLFADIYLWMKEGWIDYIVPQDYFDFDYWRKDVNGQLYEVVKYADLAKWWSWAAKETHVKLYMGMGLYRYAKEGNWSNPEEIINQLKYNHTFDNISGVVFFTYKNLVGEDIPALNEARSLLKKLWTKPSLDI